MRICHVITRLIIGGAQENTVLSCRGLAQMGHDVTLAAGPETGPEGSLWIDAEASGATLVRLTHMRRAVSPIRDWLAVHELTSLFGKLRPDVVHTHSSKAGIIARRAAAKAGVPVIIHTIHGMSFNRTQSAPVRWVYRYLERRAARHTTALVTVGDAMREQAVAAGLAPGHREEGDRKDDLCATRFVKNDLGATQLVTIRSGMDTTKFKPDERRRAEVRRAWGISDDEIVVGTVARLFVNKGYEEIIDAMPAITAQAPAVRFVWIGNGAHSDRYQRRLQSLGMRDRVVLTGLLHPEEVAANIAGFDIILHASRWEGLPRGLVQGLLTEVPAVSFDNDGAVEVVLDNETGILVPFGDTRRLAQAVIKLAQDAPLRRRLARRGRELCLATFDWHDMVARLDKLYQRLHRLHEEE